MQYLTKITVIQCIISVETNGNLKIFNYSTSHIEMNDRTKFHLFIIVRIIQQ